MFQYIRKKIKNIQTLLRRFFIGKSIDILNLRVEKSEESIEFLSNLVGQQSRLIASIALIQHDIAESVDFNHSSDSDNDDGSIYLKIQALDDEFLN